MWDKQWILICLCLQMIHGFRMPIPSDFTETDLTEVHFTHGNLQDRTRRQTKQMFPQDLHVQFTVARQQVDLDLSINLKFNPQKVPLFVDKNGVPTRVTVPYSEDYAMYQNTDLYGSFLVTHDKNDDTHSLKQLFGTFRYNSSLYVIQPSNETTPRDRKYSVSKVPDQLLKFEYGQPEDADMLRGISEERRASITHDDTRQKRQSVIYEVEMFVVVDYRSYSTWFNLTEGNNRQADTYQMIMEYTAYLINSVDNRYKSINSADMIIDVLSAGVYIADNPAASPWSHDNAIGNQVPNSDTLSDFTLWMNSQTSLPQYDHAMALTGYDIISQSDSQSSSAGLAYKSGLCTYQATSIVEETFNFITMTTAAHELGHSLGASHDGEDNSCQNTDNYIMASVNRVSSNSDITRNLWIFSECSVDDFRNYIGILDATNNNCMLSTSSNSQQVTTLRPMGDVYTADFTCINTYGEGSFVCRSIQNYTAICTEMFCAEPGSTQCYSIIPAENLPCGQGKWCENGQCVTSSRAPTDTSDECPIGNRPGLFDNTQQTCEEYITEQPGRCYGGYTRSTCCETCSKYKISQTGCEYGDVNRTFCETMHGSGCYSNEQYCCKTCVADTSRPNCPYGDKLSGCNPVHCQYYSPDQLDSCCGTCASFLPSTTEKTTKETPTTEKTTKATPTTEKTTKETPTTEKTTKETPTTEKTTKLTPTTEKTTKVTQSTGKTTKETERTTDAVTVTVPGTDKPTTTVISTPEPFDWVVVAVGAGAGVLAVIILVVVVCCVVKRKRAKMADEETSPAKDNAYDNIAFANMDLHKPGHPPPRRGSNISQQFMNGVARPQNGHLGEQPDGYMKPVDLKTDNGVHYSAPNKPKKPLIPPNKGGNTSGTDTNKRQSKPVHYKKTGNINNAATNHPPGGLQPPTEKPRRKSDAYDSIGEVQQKYQMRRPSLPANHPASYRNPAAETNYAAINAPSGMTLLQLPSERPRRKSETYDSIGEVHHKHQSRRPSLPLNHPSTLKAVSSSASYNDIASELRKISNGDRSRHHDEYGHNNIKKTKDMANAALKPIPNITINSVYDYERSDVHPKRNHSFNKADKDENSKHREHRLNPDNAREHKRERSPGRQNKEYLDPNKYDGGSKHDDHTRRRYEGSPDRRRERSREPLDRKEHSDPRSDRKGRPHDDKNNHKSKDARRDRSRSPQKPVPRRQVTESKTRDTKHPEPSPRSNKPPSKPVPRRHPDSSQDGRSNPGFLTDDQTTIV